jgi:hypothetical protein
MWKPMLSAVLVLCAACGDNESGVQPSTGKPTPKGESANGSGAPQPPATAQAQALTEIFRLHAEFGGCGIKREQKTEDLSEFGISKSDLSALFGAKRVSARDSAGQSNGLSFTLSWTDSSTFALETLVLPSDDDFAPSCPGKTVALPTQLSLSSAATGALAASGYLFTTDSSKASGTLQARSESGKDYILRVNVTATGETTGTVSDLTVTQAAGGSSRQTKTVLEW